MTKHKHKNIDARTCMCTYMHTHHHVCAHTCMHTTTYVHIHAYTPRRMYTYMHTHHHVCAHTCVLHSYVHACSHTSLHTRMHAHTYTHRHTVKLNKEAIRRRWLRWPSSLSKQNKISACKYLKVTKSKPNPITMS